MILIAEGIAISTYLDPVTPKETAPVAMQQTNFGNVLLPTKSEVSSVLFSLFSFNLFFSFIKSSLISE